MAQADTIIDPDSTGATRVFPSTQALTTGDIAPGELGRDRLVIGFSGGAGTLEVNSENNINGVTSLSRIDSLAIGQQGPNEDGELCVIGNGTTGSASVVVEDEIRLGSNSNPLLSIGNGATVTVGAGGFSGPSNGFGPSGLIVGSYADFLSGTGNASVFVDGVNSRLDVRGSRLSVGGSGGLFGADPVGTDTLTVTNGAVVTARQKNGAVAGDITVDFTFDDALGGRVDVGGNATDGNGFTDEIIVDGSGSVLEFASGLTFNGGNARVSVTNGGEIRQIETGSLIDEFSALNAGLFGETPENFASGFGVNVRTAFDDAQLLVSGTDAEGNASRLSTTRDLNIGGGAVWTGFDAAGNATAAGLSGEVIVTDAGELQVDGDINLSAKAADAGTISVFDLDEQLQTLDLVPAARNASGRLTVGTGGLVRATTINVFEGGVLDGNGGTIAANVFLDGGTIAPGSSPGILNNDGDLEILDGLLQIEIAGSGAGMFDQLNISGDLIANMGFDIEISFLDSFIPQEGDIFNFLNISGNSSIFDTPSLINLSINGGGFFGNNAMLNFAGGSLSLVNDTQDIAPVPLPSGLPLLVAGLLGLGWVGKCRNSQTAKVA